MNKLMLTWSFLWMDVGIFAAIVLSGAISYFVLNTFYLALIILGIYFTTNFLLLYVARMRPDSMYGQNSHKKHILNGLWWTVQLLPVLGLFGTVLGFFVMFNNLFGTGFDIGNLDMAQRAMAQLSNGYSIALMSTIAGLLTSALLSFKLVVLNYEV